jgi:hypothetical protein
MTDPATGQRSFLQALKVPFDLGGVALGALFFLVMTWGARLLGIETSPWAWLDRVRDLHWSAPADAGSYATLAALKLAAVAVLGVAMCRIAAVRIARDEGVPLAEALGFSVTSLPATLGAFAFMAVAVLGFYACNALAGLASGIPGIGPVLMIVLFPLVLLSSLLLFLVAFWSALGLPLAVASLAVERNGPLDAVSRAFSYVSSRPALFFFYGATVWLLAGLLVLCAFSMEQVALWSFTHWFPAKESWDSLSEAVARALAAVEATRMPDFTGVRGSFLGGWVAWFFGVLFHLALMGWVVYYVFGGATAAYFALRRDVDGTEDEEIWVAGEDQGAFGEPERPEPAPRPPVPEKVEPSAAAEDAPKGA